VVPATAAYSASVPGAAGAADKHPGLGIQLLEAPTALANDPRAHIYILDHRAPGTTIQRKVQVSNGTTNPLDVALYGAGSDIKDGIWSPFAGHQQDELSQWITVEPATVHLNPGESIVVQTTVAVPADASSGERYAVIWAESQIPGSGPVHEVARIGVRVYLSVGKGGAPPTDFRIDSLSGARADDGRPEVLAQVHNTGGRAIDLSGSLKLTDGPGGLTAGPFRAKLGTTLAPGESEPVTVLLDKSLPAGPWNARIALQSDLTKRAAKATITFPSGDGITGPPVAAKAVPLGEHRQWLIPLAVLVLILAAIALLLFLWRRRRDTDDDEGPQPTPVVPPQRSATERLRARSR
jgi:hypothetical protein